MALQLQRIDDYRWRIPRQGKMRVEGIIYADDSLMRDISGDQAVQQVANVASLPGVVGRSIGMPDIHWGYGFAIGGVAAFDPDEGGVVSPGGVGYDINCGVRLLRSDLHVDEVRPRLATIMDRLFRDIPAGVGKGHHRFALAPGAIREVLLRGAAWAVAEGLGCPEDLQHIEDGGTVAEADPEQVSRRAVERGMDQVGTVGSGNHFIEVGCVSQIDDHEAAAAMGLADGTVTALVHSGSRGLGYQVCDVGHNIAKLERHLVSGGERTLCVHRKGATRAFPPDHPTLPEAYRTLGQPVLIPGDMGRYSYVLAGTAGAYGETFGSTCHGAGRRMSRRQAKREARGRDLKRDFERKGIEVRASSFATVAEEIPEAYKDVVEVVNVVQGAGIGRKVARLRPLGVLKG